MNHDNIKNIKDLRMFRSRLISTRLPVFLVLMPLLFSCDRTRTMRGYDFIPDMTYSRAYETFSQNPNFSDSSDDEGSGSKYCPQGLPSFQIYN